MRRIAVLACVLTISGAAITSGCARLGACGPEGDAPAHLAASDVTGSWHGESSGDLALYRDGTFATTGYWPATGFDDQPPTARAEPARGEWEVGLDFGDGEAEITLTFPGSSGAVGSSRLATYEVSGTRTHPTLFQATDQEEPDMCEFHTLKRS